jgi:hypothetical protein
VVKYFSGESGAAVEKKSVAAAVRSKAGGDDGGEVPTWEDGKKEAEVERFEGRFIGEMGGLWKEVVSMLVGGEPKNESSVVLPIPIPMEADREEPCELARQSPLEEVERERSDGVGLRRFATLSDGLRGSSLPGRSLCRRFALEGAIGREWRREEESLALSTLPPCDEGGR